MVRLPPVKMAHAPRYLSAAQIDATLEVLRAEPDRRWVSRGRGGHGLMYRDGKFWRIDVEESWEDLCAFDEEDAFRAFLAGLDVSDHHFSNRYWRWILDQMGVLSP